ncbi:sugar phosphate isomerase/epimerase family protein [Paenibacillus arenilitoris]|uniref:Sugar phosphate isomerase/epimerase n=1 Tax=Paenibacillus arenilitoris TaxID=2772299 RepID=A0A927CK06_9BACL|nr:sugar phosphate isomerase/epimerase family protein [Paenibacillus arenilitoris]MBD2867100.1 sugar phosphate isomerase/epimerase [Paenibacillus arenilitoris]
MKMTNKIGVIVDSFRVGVRQGLLKAKEVGAEGVQLYAVHGELDPAVLSAAQRKEWKSYIDSLGLEISAIVGDLGGHGFQDKLANPQKIEKSKRILDLALELGTNVVTTHIGVVPTDPNGELYETLQLACEELADYAHRMNAFFAIETGPETCAHLKRFLDGLGSKGVSVNFDPANLVMVTGDDPVQGVYTLRDYIVHTHVKDGIQIRKIDPRLLYKSLECEQLDGDAYNELWSAIKEVPLGEGSVNWERYLEALADVGYSGYLTIEREVGDRPETDISRAVQFLNRFRW